MESRSTPEYEAHARIIEVSQFTTIAVSLATLGASLAVLSFTSRYVIDFIEDLIKITGLGETSIGFALLSVITSAPEFTVAIFSVLEGTPSLSVGDLLGSNVFNLGIVVGVLMVTSGFLKECPESLDGLADILLLSSIIPLVLMALEVPIAALGLGLLAVFFLTVYRETRTRPLQPLASQPTEKKRGRTSIILLKILGGMAIVVVSARFAVSSALEIAGLFNVAPIVMGALIVALGTSLPELSLSLNAVKRGRTMLATANAIGSNLTNLTLILGVILLSSLVHPFQLDVAIFSEIIAFVLISSLIIWYHMTKGADCRLIGIALIGVYILFQAVTILQ